MNIEFDVHTHTIASCYAILSTSVTNMLYNDYNHY